jgi:hypothetical protein
MDSTTLYTPLQKTPALFYATMLCYVYNNEESIIKARVVVSFDGDGSKSSREKHNSN